MLLLYIQGTSAYLAAFLPGGYFATARRAGNKIVIWPPPTKDNSLISETHKRITVRNASNKISRSDSNLYMQEIICVLYKIHDFTKLYVIIIIIYVAF